MTDCRCGEPAYANLDVLGSTIDRAIRSGLALEDAERRLHAWEEVERTRATPAGITSQRIWEARAKVEHHQRLVRLTVATVDAVQLVRP